MSYARWPLVALVAAATFATSCKKKDPPLPPSVTAASASASADPFLAEAQKAAKRQRFQEAIVYVDGEELAVMRLTELPPALKPVMLKLPDGREVPRYRYDEYLEALGVDMAKVKALHIYGGRTRVSIISGDMARRFRETLRFDFLRGENGGKTRMRYPDGRDGFRTNTTIDLVVALAVYVKKDPPEFDQAEGEFHWPDGGVVEGIPYAPQEEGHGTRFYVDGKLVSAMHRKTLPDKLLMEDSAPGHVRFSLTKYLDSVGVDAKQAKAVDFVWNDDVFARMSGPSWGRERESVAFSIPAHSHGKVAIHLPEDTKDAGALITESKISAVQLYVRATPPDRKFRAPEGGGNEVTSNGSGNIRQQSDNSVNSGENQGNKGNRRPARDVLSGGREDDQE